MIEDERRIGNSVSIIVSAQKKHAMTSLIRYLHIAATRVQLEVVRSGRHLLSSRIEIERNIGSNSLICFRVRCLRDQDRQGKNHYQKQCELRFHLCSLLSARKKSARVSRALLLG